MIVIMSETLFAYLLRVAVCHRTLLSKELLFHRGDVVQSLFLVTEGSIVLVRHQTDGKPAMLQRATGGMIVAEASLFSDCYHCDAIVTEPTHIAVIPRRRVRDLLVADPRFSDQWIRHLSNELQTTRRRAEILSLGTRR